MKIDSIRISNILSFKFYENIDDCDEYLMDDDINIMIGPNGAGKSNFIDIINQLFKRILINNYTLNEKNIAKYNEEPYEHDLRGTIRDNRMPVELKKNYQSQTEKKEIKIKLTLSGDDIQNLEFILNNVEKIQNLFKYCYFPSPLPKKGKISVSDIHSIKQLTLHIIENGNKFEVNRKNLTEVEIFVLDYITYFHLTNHLIYLGIHYHGEQWSLMKNTFALLGEIRNYSAMVSKHRLEEDQTNQQNNLILNINKENTRRSDSEPAIFTLVKNKLSILLNDFVVEHTNEISSKPPQQRLSEDSYFTQIRDAIEEMLNLKLKIEISGVSSEFYFYFIDNMNNKIDVLDLSAGEKSILLFVFIIYGYHLRDGLMIIDEPELHIHPQIQKKFLRLVTKAIKQFNLQIFMVTHSPIFVDYETIRKVSRFYRDNNNFTRIIKPNIDEMDSSLVRYLTYTNSSKIFFSNKIILVEGPTDEFFYRVFLNKILYLSNKDLDVEILNIQGKDDFYGWRNFLNKYKIQNYYIGDLDNIFNASLGLMNPTMLKSFEDNFISSNTIFDEKVKNDSNYKNKKEFRKSLLDYIKAMSSEWNTIMSNITSKYSENIFILKEGELEDYLGIGNKGLKSVIDFCESTISDWFETGSSKEIQNIFTKILN